MNKPTIALARLFAICTEWRCLYKSMEDFGSCHDKDDARRRMLELSGEITRLENETGVMSRDVERVAKELGWLK
jgi:hypothetical protein